jgi:hypothetical protein
MTVLRFFFWVLFLFRFNGVDIVFYLLFTLFDTNTFDLAIANYFATSVLLLVCLSDFKMDGVRIYTKKVIVGMW